VLAAALLAGTVMALVAGVSVGSVSFPVGAVWRVVGHHLLPSVVAPGADPAIDQIVWDLRVPRALLALLVGAGLAVVGAALQALVRNPLADPFVLGVSSGGALGAVAVLVLGGAALPAIGVAGAAFLSALATTALVFLLAHGAGGLAPARLLLAGVAVSYLGTAGVSLMVFLSDDPQAAESVLFWTLGSVAGAEFGDLGLPAAVLAAGTGWLVLQGRALNALVAGDDTATSLGVGVGRFRVQLLVVAALVAGVLVSVAGAVGFAGLMVPHMVRAVAGADHRRLLPLAALLGGLFLVVADLLARVVARPAELPLGIVTAGFGVPFFLVLLRRRSGQGGR